MGEPRTEPEVEVDVEVYRDGTIVTFTPKTDAATEWIEANVESESYQWLGPALCVEHRYAEPLAAGMMEAGLEVEVR